VRRRDSYSAAPILYLGPRSSSPRSSAASQSRLAVKRRERIGEWWLYPSAIGYDREQEIAHQHGLDVKFGKEQVDEFRQLVAEAEREGS
jgi:hypothetical protein